MLGNKEQGGPPTPSATIAIAPFNLQPDQRMPLENGNEEQRGSHSQTSATENPSNGQTENPVGTNQSQPTTVPVVRPPPPSMLPRPSEDTITLPSLRAIHHVPEATLVENESVYDATPVNNDDNQQLPWWKLRQTRLFLSLFLLILVAMAVTIGVLVSSSGSNDSADGESSVGGEMDGPLQTEFPSESPSTMPSQLPSQLPSDLTTLDWWSSMPHNQLSKLIKGEESGDYFGHSVSFSPDSNLLAIGAPQLDNNGQGYVNIYRFEEVTSSFTQLGETLEGGLGDFDYFGTSLSFSSDSKLLAIGASQFGGPGYVIIYRINEDASTFTQFGDTLVGDDDGDRFGMSLSFSPDSNLLAIGANQAGYQWGDNKPGYVKLYRINEGESSLTQFGNTLKGGRHDDRFGGSLSFSSDSNLLVIGASQNGNGGKGYVSMYRLDEEKSSFTQFGDTLEGGDDGDEFGFSVSLSSDSNLLAVGASQNGNDGKGYVNVYNVYVLNEDSPAYIQFGDTLEGDDYGDSFGWSLSFSSDSNLLAIGASQLGNDDAPGYVNMYRIDQDASTLTQFGDTLVGNDESDGFGWSLSFSPDSNLLAIGAPQWERYGHGHASVYSR